MTDSAPTEFFAKGRWTWGWKFHEDPVDAGVKEMRFYDDAHRWEGVEVFDLDPEKGFLVLYRRLR